MEDKSEIFNPYYLKRKGKINIGFIFSVMYCSKIKCIEKQIIYIFYIANIIPHEFLKYNKYKIDKSFLLDLIFRLASDKKYITKMELREATGLKDRGTFNKYFGEHLNTLNLSNNRAFSLKEVYKILQYWQGDDKWGRLRAFSKGELANRFAGGNYEDLEISITNVFNHNFSTYKHYDYIKPADVKILIHQVLEKSEAKKIYDRNFNTDYLSFFFTLFVLNNYASNHNS